MLTYIIFNKKKIVEKNKKFCLFFVKSIKHVNQSIYIIHCKFFLKEVFKEKG